VTTASHFHANLRDTFFQLFEVLGIQSSVLGKPPFASMDEEAARAAIEGLLEVVQAHWTPTFASGDREGAQLGPDGNVRLPTGFHRALDAYYQGGWNKLELPEALGGFGAPPSVRWAAFELMAAANPALCFYVFGNVMAQIIDSMGTPAQRARYVRGLAELRWGATMVLTEPGAGSDVGAGTTRARHVGGDEWHLEGTKRFITNGDFDYPKNIVHMVLARPEGAVAGTKGLSMFIVPKVWVEADGRFGERNGVIVSKVEHKMGLRGSATCELQLGDGRPCRGLLLGDVHDGIAQMFHVIEYARMGVGTKSMATLSTAYANALAYARVRKQGADLVRQTDKTAPRVEILRHPDVRRMLMLQKAYAEGLRATVLWTAHVQDQVAQHGGQRNPEAARFAALNDLMLPLVKGFGSEKVYELLGLALQCFGGSGYCQDYPIEQYIRDQKIDSLYEGTTHIQALDLFFRKIARDRGATLTALCGEIAKTVDELPAELAVEQRALRTALSDLQTMMAAITAKLGASLYHVGLHGNRILFALGQLVVGWRLAVSAVVAARALPASRGNDAAFYRGKLAASRFFASEVLPEVSLARQLVERGDLAVMEIADDAW
jgi:alkylation response protein AidB-like acyl-CoA dehydrogenase